MLYIFLISVAEIERGAAERPPNEQAELTAWLLNQLPLELLKSSGKARPFRPRLPKSF
jgi:hypothetical protein